MSGSKSLAGQARRLAADYRGSPLQAHREVADVLSKLAAENKSALNSITDLAQQTATQAEEILRLRDIITAAYEAARDDNEISAFLILRDAAMDFPSVPQAPPCITEGASDMHTDDINDAVAAQIEADMGGGLCWACRCEHDQPHAAGCPEAAPEPPPR